MQNIVSTYYETRLTSVFIILCGTPVMLFVMVLKLRINHWGVSEH